MLIYLTSHSVPMSHRWVASRASLWTFLQHFTFLSLLHQQNSAKLSRAALIFWYLLHNLTMDWNYTYQGKMGIKWHCHPFVTEHERSITSILFQAWTHCTHHSAAHKPHIISTVIALLQPICYHFDASWDASGCVLLVWCAEILVHYAYCSNWVEGCSSSHFPTDHES